MGRGLDSRAGRRAWLAGRVAVLLVIAIAGVLAIVHYSSLGPTLADAMHHPSATIPRHARTAARQHRSRPAAAAPIADPVAPQQPATPNRIATPSASDSSSPASGATPAAPTASPSPSPSSSPGAPVHFRTLPPGAKLPSDAQCAHWVLATPLAEDKSANWPYNHTTGQHVGPDFFPAADNPLARQLLAPRIDGDFTGTTPEILRWAACKWGINQNIVFAQAAVQSWWQQNTLGHWGTNPRLCPPGHGLGADGRPGKCPQSYGILQNRFGSEPGSWPGIGNSTAMNADAAYAIWRSCYDGYETWLNEMPRGQQYRAGDVWGCIGRWHTGRWHTPSAQRYIASVQEYLRERIWEQPYFKQTS